MQPASGGRGSLPTARTAIDHSGQGQLFQGAGGWRARQVGNAQKRQGLVDGAMGHAGGIVAPTAFHRQAMAANRAHVIGGVYEDGPCLLPKIGRC